MMRGAAGAQRGALVVADILACLCGGAMMEGWMEGADLSLCDNSEATNSSNYRGRYNTDDACCKVIPARALNLI